MLWQPEIPKKYREASETALSQIIRARRSELGNRLMILGHHYQQDEVIQHADFIGDSLKLSQTAAADSSVVMWDCWDRGIGHSENCHAKERCAVTSDRR